MAKLRRSSGQESMVLMGKVSKRECPKMGEPPPQRIGWLSFGVLRKQDQKGPLVQESPYGVVDEFWKGMPPKRGFLVKGGQVLLS